MAVKAVEELFLEHFLRVSLQVDSAVSFLNGGDQRFLRGAAAQNGLNVRVEKRRLLQSAVENAAVAQTQIDSVTELPHRGTDLAVVCGRNGVLRRHAEGGAGQINCSHEIQHQRDGCLFARRQSRLRLQQAGTVTLGHIDIGAAVAADKVQRDVLGGMAVLEDPEGVVGLFGN